jgi:hypothetical protein
MVVLVLLLHLHLSTCSCLTEAFARLYPPSEYAARNALSRTDGYWPWVSKKQEPPPEHTYGEFPLPFFSQILDRAWAVAGTHDDRSEAVFCDLGSGTGRLVLWAAAAHRWREVIGVELLPSLHAEAVAKRDAATALHDDPQFELTILTPHISLHEGSWDNGALYQRPGRTQFAEGATLTADLACGYRLPWDTVDVCFAYTTAFPHRSESPHRSGVLDDLSAALRDRLRAGCIVCTTEHTVAWSGSTPSTRTC